MEGGKHETIIIASGVHTGLLYLTDCRALPATLTVAKKRRTNSSRWSLIDLGIPYSEDTKRPTTPHSIECLIVPDPGQMEYTTITGNTIITGITTGNTIITGNNNIRNIIITGITRNTLCSSVLRALVVHNTRASRERPNTVTASLFV